MFRSVETIRMRRPFQTSRYLSKPLARTSRPGWVSSKFRRSRSHLKRVCRCANICSDAFLFNVSTQTILVSTFTLQSYAFGRFIIASKLNLFSEKPFSDISWRLTSSFSQMEIFCDAIAHVWNRAPVQRCNAGDLPCLQAETGPVSAWRYVVPNIDLMFTSKLTSPTPFASFSFVYPSATCQGKLSVETKRQTVQCSDSSQCFALPPGSRKTCPELQSQNEFFTKI